MHQSLTSTILLFTSMLGKARSSCATSARLANMSAVCPSWIKQKSLWLLSTCSCISTVRHKPPTPRWHQSQAAIGRALWLPPCFPLQPQRTAEHQTVERKVRGIKLGVLGLPAEQFFHTLFGRLAFVPGWAKNKRTTSKWPLLLATASAVRPFYVTQRKR